MTEEMESKEKNLKEKTSLIESLQQKLKEKADESETASDEKECGICFEPFSDKRRAMCFFPCGHARTCQTCYQNLPDPKQCPNCRLKIKKAAVLFY